MAMPFKKRNKYMKSNRCKMCGHLQDLNIRKNWSLML